MAGMLLIPTWFCRCVLYKPLCKYLHLNTLKHLMGNGADMGKPEVPRWWLLLSLSIYTPLCLIVWWGWVVFPFLCQVCCNETGSIVLQHFWVSHVFWGALLLGLHCFCSSMLTQLTSVKIYLPLGVLFFFHQHFWCSFPVLYDCFKVTWQFSSCHWLCFIYLLFLDPEFLHHLF